jgi:YidC/Oxa1 family membrane protein insertase
MATTRRVLLEDAAKPYVVQYPGLTGAGLPNHRSLFSAEADSYSLGEGKDTLEVSLRASSSSIELTRTYVFHRGQYVIDVRLDANNASAQPVATSAYFQMLRHGDAPADAPHFQATYTGPVVLQTTPTSTTRWTSNRCARARPSTPARAATARWH